MTNRRLNLVVLIFWLISGVLIPLAPPARADGPSWSFISPDLDGDGLPNVAEETGWCNAVGCFTTDPLDLDSDDDTLTDGEEKLFDSSPMSAGSPGIYAIYEDAFKTKEYYPWQNYGHKLIARADANNSGFVPSNPDELDVQKGFGTNLDAIIVRRGTTITVGGPVDETLQINESIPALDTLSKTQDPFTGEWVVTIPANGTVGKYTLTLGSESLDLFVIFELPTLAGELTQGGIDRFVYDDNPSFTRDTQAIVLGDNRYPPSVGSPYDTQLNNQTNFIEEGKPYAFTTYQYNRYIFEGYVMDTINGKTNQKDAVDALTDKVDALTVFRNPRVFHNSWEVLNPGVNPRQQCSNISGLLTAFNRAAGVAARPVMVDWEGVNGSFDHATEVWLNGDWSVYRGYKTFEMKKENDDHQGCPDSVWPQCGTWKYQTRYNWGKNRYKPFHSGGGSNGVVIVLADDNWTSTGGEAYRWPSWITAEWVSPASPTTTVVAQGVKMNLNTNKLKTKNAVYWGEWGWTQEPENLGNPGWPPCPNCGPFGLNVLTQQGGSLDFQSAEVQLGDVVNEYGVDTNGNGRYDQLVLEVEVTASQPGRYWLQGQLGATQTNQELSARGGIVAAALANPELAVGTQLVPLVFGGTDIALTRMDGPYLLNVAITDVEEPSPEAFANDSLAHGANVYQTAQYKANAFETYGAMLSNKYSHRGVDSNGDGRLDALAVDTGIAVTQPGNYTVEGSLYDSQDQYISHATWSGSGSDVTLTFADLAGSVGPYTLQEVNLLNANGQSIDLVGGGAYTIDSLPDLALPAVASLGVYPAGELSAMGVNITPTLTFNEAVVDGNLQISAGVQVAVAGSYKLEAWLADTNGNLVTWASGQPTNLAAGAQTLAVTFNGKHIRARGIGGPYTVVAVKILDGNTSYQVLDKVDVAFTTQAYALNQFTALDHTLFEDYVENGGSQWTAENPWSIEEATHQYFSPSEAWHAGDANALLTMATPLDLSSFDKAALKFTTSHKFGGGETGKVEVSTNGSLWLPVLTLSGNSAWSGQTQVVDLNAYAGQPAVYIRFQLDSLSGGANDGWYIDDVVVAGIPDSDGDGLADDDETEIYLTDPDDPDTDDDGMDDGWEVEHGFNPLVNDASGDADSDGLTNLEEYQHETNPHNPDSESDGLPDGWEVDYIFDPLDSTGENGPDGDPDQDEFTNLQEYQNGTDPRNPDTDGDGIPDGQDPEPGAAFKKLFLPIIKK